jgi:hypothetical protein
MSRRREQELLRRFERTYERVCDLLEEILHHVKPHITAFQIKETTMLAIAPGLNPEFTATPVPAEGKPTTAPTWTSSDTTNAPITVDSTGLIATVNIPATAVVGTQFVLTISYTNPDGTVAKGTTTQTIVPVPPVDITSFEIKQTA